MEVRKKTRAGGASSGLYGPIEGEVNITRAEERQSLVRNAVVVKAAIEAGYV